MRLELDGHELLLRAPTNAGVIVTRIPGARFDKDRQVWVLKLSWASCVTARGVIGDELEIGPKLTAWAKQEQDRRVKPSMALREAKEVPESWDPWFNRIEGGAV